MSILRLDTPTPLSDPGYEILPPEHLYSELTGPTSGRSTLGGASTAGSIGDYCKAGPDTGVQGIEDTYAATTFQVIGRFRA